MSRCGSCPLYWTDPMCKGDLGVEECAEKLQSFGSELLYRADKATIRCNTLLEVLRKAEARAEKAERERDAALQQLEIKIKEQASAKYTNPYPPMMPNMPMVEMKEE